MTIAKQVKLPKCKVVWLPARRLSSSRSAQKANHVYSRIFSVFLCLGKANKQVLCCLFFQVKKNNSSRVRRQTMKITLKTLQQKQYEVEVPDDATVRLPQSKFFYDNLDLF